MWFVVGGRIDMFVVVAVVLLGEIAVATDSGIVTATGIAIATVVGIEAKAY